MFGISRLFLHFWTQTSVCSYMPAKWTTSATMYVRYVLMWLIRMCDMTHSCVWHYSFVRMTWFIRVCDVTLSYVWHDSFVRVTWLIRVCDMTHSYVWHDSFINYVRVMCVDMTPSYVWHDTLVRMCQQKRNGLLQYYPLPHLFTSPPLLFSCAPSPTYKSTKSQETQIFKVTNKKKLRTRKN